MVAMTATASEEMIVSIKKELGMGSNTRLVRRSPNRDNIFFAKIERAPSKSGLESFEKILEPLAKDLLLKRKLHPITIVYMKLRYCAVAYKLFERILKNDQYVDGIEDPSHRLFCQYYAPRTERMKKDTLDAILKEDSNISYFCNFSPWRGSGCSLRGSNIAHNTTS